MRLRPALTRLLLCLAIGAVVVTLPPLARATMTVGPLPLRQMTAEAVRIVHGRVVAVRSDRDERGLPATWITLEVLDALKGGAASETTIKQFGVADPLPDGTAASIIGMPRFTPGEEVVLFLYGESTLGFTSPIGLGQGVYRVEDTANGVADTVNGVAGTANGVAGTANGAAATANARQLRRDAPDGPEDSPDALATFLATVRNLVAHPEAAP